MQREMIVLLVAAACASPRPVVVADDWPQAVARAQSPDAVLLVELWARW